VDYVLAQLSWCAFHLHLLLLSSLPLPDRNAIALARLNTLEKDLGLVGSQYQTCVSILFVGYVIVGIPANMVVTRVRPSLWMSACMAVWAIISLLTAFSRNYIGLLMTRFTLGITEAPYYPGALYILATFYTRKELATRISILYTGNILATAFAGLIALGIFKMHGMAGFAGWQWLFILQGAVGFYFHMHEHISPTDSLTPKIGHPGCCNRCRLYSPRRATDYPMAH
jgi:MFS family permease